jgi:hypothetical protein
MSREDFDTLVTHIKLRAKAVITALLLQLTGRRWLARLLSASVGNVTIWLAVPRLCDYIAKSLIIRRQLQPRR